MTPAIGARPWKKLLPGVTKRFPSVCFFENHDRPALHETEPVLKKGGPLAHRSLGISAKLGQSLVDKLI